MTLRRADARPRAASAPATAAAALAALLLGALGAGIAGCGGGGATLPVAIGEDAPAGFLVASADTALGSGDVEGARRLLDRALRAAPESASVHVAWGRLQTALRRYKDAKEAFDRAAALAPRSPEPPYWLGRAYQQSGDPEAAARSFADALRVDPAHRPSSEALAPILGARYEAAGVPPEYALLRDRATVSRGELAVILAVELGADPDRSVWRSDARLDGDEEELDASWGARWVRAAAARGWIEPFADGSYRLNDPVTRAGLALTVVGLERRWGPRASATVGAGDGAAPRSFADLGPRHYLARAAAEATGYGLPSRSDDGRFEPWAAANGTEALRTVRALARVLGATPVVSAEPH
ncbi:MAG TPA: tetratricopeptide repeat protein [Candidatus Eisenbacteria bacterium]|nr:tetratricopeptide repeat protein [Candidatus Eisenbacteria bacterium]